MADLEESKPPSSPRSEFILAERVEADTEPDLVLLPAEGKSRAEIQSELEAENRSRYLLPPPAEPAEVLLRFSLADLFLITTCCGLGLAGATWVRPDIYAGVLGVVSLVVLPIFYAVGAEPHVLRRVWMVTLTIYLMACVTALVRLFVGHAPLE